MSSVRAGSGVAASGGAGTDRSQDARVAALTVYPVKSCGAVHLTEAVLEPRGLRHDRRFVVVDADGRFLTQREEPRLALVRITLDGGVLSLEAPGHLETRYPASPDEAPLGPMRRIAVWDDVVDAPEAPDLTALFRAFLGRDVRCVAMPEWVRRPVDPRYAREGELVSFADGFPLLVTNEASRRDLEARAGVPLAMARFRPNLVVDGVEPWAEDGWGALRVAGARLRVVKPCARCVVTTIDPETAEAGKEPLRTLATFRRFGSEVHFGQNVVPELRPGRATTVRVGDPIVIERVESFGRGEDVSGIR